jgi:hypothetical protein
MGVHIPIYDQLVADLVERTPIYDQLVRELGLNPLLKQIKRSTIVGHTHAGFLPGLWPRRAPEMSCYESEWGTIKLPTAATAAVKTAVRDANNKLHDQLYTLARDFWAKNTTRSSKKYQDAIQVMELDVARFPQRYPNPDLMHELRWLLESVADKPRGLTHDDIARAIPVATNRSVAFNYGDFSITFAGNLVNWNVPDNNRAVEHAHDHPVAKAFFHALKQVKWTRGSGGQLLGNNEYNRDSNYEGGGGNFVTSEFGPPVAKRRSSIYSTGRLR